MKDFNCSLVLTTLLLFWNRITLSNCAKSTCATLQSGQDNNNNSVVLNDNDKIGNIANGYVSRNKKWKMGGYEDTTYWKVNTNCVVTLCSDVYLQGKCLNYTESRNRRISYEYSSVSCSCNRNCSCSGINLKPNVCARAYFNSDGCNTCNAPYTELENSSLVFPQQWADKVESFLIRPGCTVTVYSEEDHEGDSKVVEERFVQNQFGTIGSYECQCDSTKYSSSAPRFEHASNSNSNPPTLQISNTLDDVVSQLNARNFTHEGLQAAFSSLAHGRSSKSAYILVLGSSGAGKSTMINKLLGENVTLVGGQQSTTASIVEFRIPVPVEKLGVANSELVIVDTPGLTDTTGVEKDALFLTTLDDYLTGHAELKNKIPNLVLILHSFADNRFHGDSAKFVNMVRALSNFRTQITDDKFSNVLFVFSHLCSEVKSLQRNPAPRLMQFEEVIEKYTLFPKPIQSTVIENHGKDNELPMINGNYEMPNKEYFPRNLLQLFGTITKKGSDLIGQAIIDSAFEKGFENANITHRTFQLVNPTHSKVPVYLNILRASALSIDSSEVSVLLSNAFRNMSQSLKASDPLSLKYLQNYLSIRNIRTKSDLPKTTIGILKLYDGMKQNNAIFYLLLHGLSIQQPKMRDFGIGKSYDILKDKVLTGSIILLDTNNTYKLPNYWYKLPTHPAAKIKIYDEPFVGYEQIRSFDTKESYVDFMLNRFGVNSSPIKGKDSLSKFTITPSFYVKDSVCSYRSAVHECSFMGRIYYTTLTLELDDDNIRLSPSFKNQVTALPKYDETSPDNVNLWTNFFTQYGTHVVSKINIGGRIDVKMSSTNSFSDKVKDNVFLPVQFVDDLSLLTRNKINPKNTFPSGVSQSLTFFGGDPNLKTNDLTKFKLLDAHKLLKKWKHSLKFNPDAHPLKWIKLREVIEMGMEDGNLLAKKVEHAMGLLLNGNLKFNPDELAAKLLIENQRRKDVLRRLEEERRRKVLAQIEARRKQALEEQRRREEAIRRQNELRRQQEEKERRDREEAERREREHQQWLEEQRQYRLWQQRQRQQIIDSMYESNESDESSEEEDSPEYFNPVQPIHAVGRVVGRVVEGVGRDVVSVANDVGKGVAGVANEVGKGFTSAWNSVFGG